MNSHLLAIRLAFVPVLTSGLILLGGCSSIPERFRMTTKLAKSDVATEQINQSLFDFATGFSRTVERAADQIAQDSSEARARHNALLWKLNAIPAAYLAAEHADPLAMLVDLWALCVQQTMYFESGAGKDLFGAQQRVAVQASMKMQREISKTAAQFIKPEVLAFARKEIGKWAANHPLQDHLFARPSIIAVLPQAFPDRPPGIFEALNTVQAELADVKGRLALQFDHLPRQARWQAELLADQISTEIVGAQLTNAFEFFTSEREAILAEIDRQRVETIESVRAESGAALQSISDQRVATLEQVRLIMQEMLSEVGRVVDAQREAIVQVVDTQRKAIFADVRPGPMPFRHDMEQLVESAMDRAFARLLLLLGIVYVVLMGTALFWYALIRKHRRTAEPRSL